MAENIMFVLCVAVGVLAGVIAFPHLPKKLLGFLKIPVVIVLAALDFWLFVYSSTETTAILVPVLLCLLSALLTVAGAKHLES